MKDIKKETAKKLTLKEIEALPKASVIWGSCISKSDDGIVWNDVYPLLVAIPGESGRLIGADEDSIWDYHIKELKDWADVDFWDKEPVKEQLSGISRYEYNQLSGRDDDLIKFPALATLITSRGISFDALCELTGLKLNSFWDALIGEREFELWEMAKIRSSLNLTNVETRNAFFPEFSAPVFDIRTGKRIEQPETTQI